MREYRPYKHQMGVEGPSFFREQQERRQQERHGRDQPQTQEPAPKQQSSMWETRFGPAQEQAAPAAEPVSPALQRRGLSPVDPAKWFEMPDIWDYVARGRASGVRAFVVSELTMPAADLGDAAWKIAQFLGLPPNVFDGLSLDDAWKQVLGPFLESLEFSMSRMKPFSLPGGLRFEVDEDDRRLLLVYRDR